MSNIDKIRQEIERRRDFFYERYIQKGIGCIEETRYDECVEILSFIDSLPDCTVKTSGQGRVKDNVYDSLTEEKPSKDLEEAAEEYATTHLRNNEFQTSDNAFIAGAEWQKEQMMKDYIPKETAKKIARGSLGVQDFIRKIDRYKED